MKIRFNGNELEVREAKRHAEIEHFTRKQIETIESEKRRWQEEAALREAARNAEIEHMRKKQDDLMRMLIEERNRAANPIVLSPSPRDRKGKDPKKPSSSISREASGDPKVLIE